MEIVNTLQNDLERNISCLREIMGIQFGAEVDRNLEESIKNKVEKFSSTLKDFEFELLVIKRLMMLKSKFGGGE